MLLGEGLRGRHQRALTPVLDRAQERVERYDRLPRADVPLQETLHGNGAHEIDVDVLDRALLMLGQAKREYVAIAGNEVAGGTERRRDLRLTFPAPRSQTDLQDEQLVEGEPRTTFLRLLARPRPVQSPQRIASLRQALALLHSGRERVQSRPRQRRTDELAELLRRDLLARRIDGREVRRRRRPADVERLDEELVAPLHASAEASAGPRLQQLLEPRLVEPHGGHLAGRVGDDRGLDRQSASRAP